MENVEAVEARYVRKAWEMGHLSELGVENSSQSSE